MMDGFMLQFFPTAIFACGAVVILFLRNHTLGAALVLLGFFWNDWVRIVRGLFRSLRLRAIREDDPDAKLAWLLIVSTIPTGILGITFEDQIRSYFTGAVSAAAFLVANGALLYGAELLRRKFARNAAAPEGGDMSARASDARIAKLTWWQGIKVGTMQILALMPGFSRTGSAIAGGLLVGLSHEDAVRFSFLLATPVIGAAAALELPQLALAGNGAVIGISLAGAACSAVFAYLSVRFLTKYFEFEGHKLTPFAAYCAIVGAAALLLFAVGR
jgi:undecaprenyl-diphosphatase